MSKLYGTKEVSKILGIQPQSVYLYYKNYGIGTMGIGRNITFTEEDIEKIKITDGRRK